MTNLLHPNYTRDTNIYQLMLPMDIGELIPSDDSVRLLSETHETRAATDGERILKREFTTEGQTSILVYDDLFSGRGGIPYRRYLSILRSPRALFIFIKRTAELVKASADGIVRMKEDMQPTESLIHNSVIYHNEAVVCQYALI